MLGPLDDHNLRDYLTAFADGELDAAQTLAMWTYLAEHPDRVTALRWLQDQQRLTLATRQAMGRTAPHDLRDRIANLAGSERAMDAVDDSPAPDVMFIGREKRRRRTGYLLALAAGLVIGLTIATTLTRTGAVANVLPAEIVSTAGEIHAYCSRLPAALHGASFEATNAPLAATMKVSLGGDSAVPDLKSVGFQYVGAGPCSAESIETVHLLYHALRPTSKAAVSLFVQTDHGQYPKLESGHVYRVSSPTSPFPMLAWRDGKVIYFVLADQDKTAMAVLQILRPTVPDQVLTAASR